MMAVARLQPRPVQWPFWLLIVAWVCANVPPTALFATFAWLAEARHFNHQQRVALDVARLLGGEAGADRIEAASAEDGPRPAPAIPADAKVKKGVLALESTGDAVVAELTPARWSRTGLRWPEVRREPPPHEPPRRLV